MVVLTAMALAVMTGLLLADSMLTGAWDWSLCLKSTGLGHTLVETCPRQDP